MRIGVCFGGAASIALIGPFARASDPVLVVPASMLQSVVHAGRSEGGSLSGVELRVDAGASTRFAVAGDPTEGAGSFGASLGYAWRNGVSLDARYDDLGAARTDLAATPLQTASAGLRYAAPLVVMPFGEVRCGTAFDTTGAFFAAALAVGVDVPFTRYLSAEVTVRDWLVPDQVALRSIATFQVGLTVRFVK
ncbi:MAG TPA: hypothetical protein VLM85_04285 [Polyangiaceae bacterium]|nr:hypothetical protein [Polyangiaceae bacterium]